MSDRYRGVLRQVDARLLYKSFQHRMVEMGYGKYIFDWDFMPEDARAAWVECVSRMINDDLEAVVRTLANRYQVPHYTEPPWQEDR